MILNKYNVSLVCFLICYSALASVGEAYRPVAIQKEVDAAFKRLNQGSGSWLYDGGGFYDLMNFDEEKIIEDIANRDDSQKDIYLVDVGAAKGGWSRDAERFIKEKLFDCEKHFHIFSFTGADELKEEVVTTENITHYRFNRFKIENMGSELKKRGINLTGKVDLMVSNWTLRHLVDPFGTLAEMYQLLSPKNGILMTNGFLFTVNDSQEVQTQESLPKVVSSREFWSVFTPSSTQFVFRPWDSGRDVDQFMLIRTDDRLLDLPLEYSGEIENPGWGYQIASERVCNYKLTAASEAHPKRVVWHGRGETGFRAYDWYYGDSSSLKTFERFKLQRWILPSWEEKKQAKLAERALQTYKAIHLGGQETTESKMITNTLLGVSGDASESQKYQAKENFVRALNRLDGLVN